MGMVGNGGQEFLQQVFILVDNLQVNLPGIIHHRLETALVFLVGMDIMVEKETGYPVAGSPQGFQRIDGARSATDVEKYMHGAIILQGSHVWQRSISGCPHGLDSLVH